jgi:sulfatase maturation enzyme AslB (radical SAM superfamily)
MKILCLGNNTEDTYIKTKSLAQQDLVECHGLLSDLDNKINVNSINSPGYYHTSVYDMEYGKLFEFAKRFEKIIVLNQPKEQYSHPDAFFKTIQLAKELRQFTTVLLLNPQYELDINFFENLVNTNKSFCIFPFIELLTNQRTDGQTTLCCRSSAPVAKLNEITNFASDKNYKIIRDKMIAGILVPEHCSSCYKLEELGILSAREQETVEWANRLDLKSLADLELIEHPAYYEIRPSHICNLQCRMCSPSSSHLIGKEYKKINLIKELPPAERSNFDIVNFTNLKKLYVAGGEPTAMPEFYDFLDRCIDENKTFEFLVNTNATKISNRFKKQLKALPHMQFIISIEGISELNHYIRWPSNWDVIVENMKYLVANNYKITTNTTVSIYNVTRLYELLKWFDDEFPGMIVHALPANSNDDILSALRFPNTSLALANLLPIRQLKCYNNDKLLKSFVDGLIVHYQSAPKVDQEKLKLFFEFNDKLDKSRNILLKDYIPELEQERKLVL